MLRNVCVTNDHGYVQFVVITIWFFHIQVCTNSNMIGATSGAGTANPSGAHELIPCFAQSLVLCAVVCRSLSFLFWLMLLDICNNVT